MDKAGKAIGGERENDGHKGVKRAVGHWVSITVGGNKKTTGRQRGGG